MVSGWPAAAARFLYARLNAARLSFGSPRDRCSRPGYPRLDKVVVAADVMLAAGEEVPPFGVALPPFSLFSETAGDVRGDR